MNSVHVLLVITGFPIDKHKYWVVVSQEIMLMKTAWGQHCCPCPQHSPSEQHMLTMISKDVCWAVSKAVASLSSSLPLWTKTSSHVSQQPTKTMTVSTQLSSADRHNKEISINSSIQTRPATRFKLWCYWNPASTVSCLNEMWGLVGNDPTV